MRKVLVRSARLVMFAASVACMGLGVMGIHDFWNPSGDRWGPDYPWLFAWGPSFLTFGILLFKLARINILETIPAPETRVWAKTTFRYGAMLAASSVLFTGIAFMAALVFFAFMLLPGAVLMMVSGIILILRERMTSSGGVFLKTEGGRMVEKVAVTEDNEEVNTAEEFGPGVPRSSEAILLICIFAGLNAGAFIGAIAGALFQHNSLPGVFVGAFFGILAGVVAGVVISGRRG